jgi:hypothetical protein
MRDGWRVPKAQRSFGFDLVIVGDRSAAVHKTSLARRGDQITF